MKLFGASLNQTVNLCIGVFPKRKSNLILIRKDIQRLKVKTETQSLWNHPVCLTKHSEQGRRVDTLKQTSLNHPTPHLGSTSTNCSSNRQDHVWDTEQPFWDWEWTLNWLNCGIESINVTACLTTEVLGNFSLKHKCCKAVINRNSKTVSQVHELLPKKIIPSPEMKFFP